MDQWRDTPAGEQIMAERLDGERVRFHRLVVGDVVRFVAPDGGYLVPDIGDYGWEPAEDPPIAFRVISSPRQADGTEGPQDYGWVLTLEAVEDMKKALT